MNLFRPSPLLSPPHLPLDEPGIPSKLGAQHRLAEAFLWAFLWALLKLSTMIVCRPGEALQLDVGCRWKMTTLVELGLGHAPPHLNPNSKIAISIALAVVMIELRLIVWIQDRYLETPWGRVMFQVILGGALVFAADNLIGHA